MKLTKILGLAAVAAMLMLAAPSERAQAMSLSNPGAAAAVQDGSRADDDRSALGPSLSPPLAPPLVISA